MTRSVDPMKVEARADMRTAVALLRSESCPLAPELAEPLIRLLDVNIKHDYGLAVFVATRDIARALNGGCAS